MNADANKQPLLGELTAEVHVATEAMLREVLDYLLRLPAHPMTVQMARKVQAHLDAPTACLVRQQDELLAAARQAERLSRSGVSSYTPAGLPVLDVSVAASRVEVTSPAADRYGKSAQGRQFALQLAADLAKGVSIELRPWGVPPEETR